MILRCVSETATELSNTESNIAFVLVGFAILMIAIYFVSMIFTDDEI